MPTIFDIQSVLLNELKEEQECRRSCETANIFLNIISNYNECFLIHVLSTYFKMAKLYSNICVSCLVPCIQLQKCVHLTFSQVQQVSFTLTGQSYFNLEGMTVQDSLCTGNQCIQQCKHPHTNINTQDVQYIFWSCTQISFLVKDLWIKF